MQTISIRLKPSSDIRKSLEALAQENEISAAVVLGAVGSLSTVCLRFADQDRHTEIMGKHEVLTLSGMVSTEGVHIHASVSDAHGHCIGGHVVYGCKVYTTLEIVIALLPQTQFSRTFDPDTGFKELLVHNQ